MKCEALIQSNLNLVKMEQDKQSYRVMKDNGEFAMHSPEGKSIVDKRTQGKCTCNGKKIKGGFICPKIGTLKECKDKSMSKSERHDATYRATPVCHTIHKLYRKSQEVK
jgi:hypothetical protein